MQPPSGLVEPHTELLKKILGKLPSDDQSLYKVMSAENLIKSIGGNYLHFNRVDKYIDFPDDGEQLPIDRQINRNISFAKAPNFSLENYYDISRSRTYACCFSLENSDYIWEEFGNGSNLGKVCLVFHFGKLRTYINNLFQQGSYELFNNTDIKCYQIFSINYGKIKYIDRSNLRINEQFLSNPIIYTFLKDRKLCSKEKEFRISLSALGFGVYTLKDNTEKLFSNSLTLGFDFKQAFKTKIIKDIKLASNCNFDRIISEFEKVGITLHKNS